MAELTGDVSDGGVQVEPKIAHASSKRQPCRMLEFSHKRGELGCESSPTTHRSFPRDLIEPARSAQRVRHWAIGRAGGRGDGSCRAMDG